MRKSSTLYVAVLMLAAVSPHVLQMMPWMRRRYEGLPTPALLMAMQVPTLLAYLSQTIIQLHCLWSMPSLAQYEVSLITASIVTNVVTIVYIIAQKIIFILVATLTKIEDHSKGRNSFLGQKRRLGRRLSLTRSVKNVFARHGSVDAHHASEAEPSTSARTLPGVSPAPAPSQVTV